ncbi:conserved hypothetical membrane protein (DUF4271) [Formosa agariphila KMM 3901]|uniref:Conserved hypothetical membrane protein (DUF4271) n=1 Tax=Formosa agariphila (strain DSM 15362 / KCTC 12365 / LMG 23005 / KMM 3901 / M-2Alg 35-1) TaxID=1347342 RepID=T2KQX1_FORAG|nr:DUF4271 domain-containing protein [Formosa agariphila]CDF80908.1 conserved hypothetical membrane protein (DUF4271) [Formosa agariphila KMM 3901]
MLREVPYNEIFTILIMVGLICITMAKVSFTNRFNDFAAILANSKYLNIYSRDQKIIDKFDTLLFVNFVISISIFAYIFYKGLGINDTLEPNTIIKIVIGLCIFLVTKIHFERLLGSLFNIDKLIDYYLFQKTSYKNFFGILLVPVNAFLIYSITPSKTILYIILSILLVLFIISLGTSLKRYQSLIKPNLFYFILYLCTLEIAPYVILYKFVTLY